MKILSENKQWNAELATSVPFFAILVAPLGVAGQNIGLGLALLMFIILCVLDRGRAITFTLANPTARQFIILWSLILAPVTLSTLGHGNGHEARRFFGGYLFSGFMVIAGLSLRSFPIRRSVVLNITTLLLGLMGGIALSQFLVGWKFEGAHIVSQIKRAQGFYSHPLTFAYAALVLMPWSFARVMAKPQQWQSWVLFAAMSMIIVTTQSITVICLSAIVMLILMTQLLKFKTLLIGLAAGGIVATLALTTPNPIQEKFEKVLSGQRSDHETPYPDDRIAFWHAHWEMIKDAPVTGHGAGLEAEDRQPYYEKIGLGHLKRMYEAHNMYLQYWVEGGFIPVMAMIAFFTWWTLRLRSGLKTERWYRLAMLITPTAFALGGLTQNAIQDSEVRYMLLLCCSASLWFTVEKPNEHLS